MGKCLAFDLDGGEEVKKEEVTSMADSRFELRMSDKIDLVSWWWETPLTIEEGCIVAV